MGKVLREEGDLKVAELTEDLKKAKEELEILSSKDQQHDNLVNVEEEVVMLKEENEKLKSDNVALADENAELQNDQFELLEQEQTWRKEKSQLNLEAELLRNTQKFLNDKTEKVKKELKDESERVKQLNILNKMVTAENEWLKTNLKDSRYDYEKELEGMKKELMEEREKMKNQATWKFWKNTDKQIQDPDKEKELREEGSLKGSKLTEDLAQLGLFR